MTEFKLKKRPPWRRWINSYNVYRRWWGPPRAAWEATRTLWETW